MNTYIPKPRYRLKRDIGKHIAGEEGIFYGKIGSKIQVRFYAGTERRSIYGPPVTLDQEILERVQQ